MTKRLRRARSPRCCVCGASGGVFYALIDGRFVHRECAGAMATTEGSG